MKIGKPVTEIPSVRRSLNALKYGAVYDAVRDLEEGQSLPVEFDGPVEARRFRMSARTVLVRYALNQRGTTIYISRNGS